MSSSLLRSTHLITTQPDRRPFVVGRGARGARSGDVGSWSWGDGCGGALRRAGLGGWSFECKRLISSTQVRLRGGR